MFEKLSYVVWKYGREVIEPITLLFSTVIDVIVGLVITQFNDIHDKSLPVVLES